MPNPVNYYRPRTIEEAIESAHRPGSIALAGGALMLGGTLLSFETIVDLQDINELKQVSRSDQILSIGGALSLQTVVDLDAAPDALKFTISRSLGPNIRAGASVGESLAVPNLPSEWVVALAALGTRIEHAGNLDSKDNASFWQQEVAEFELYLHQHGHPYQGVIKAIHIPLPDDLTAFSTAYVSRTPADAAIVNVAARVTTDTQGIVREAVAALGGVSAEPVIVTGLRDLAGESLNAASIAEAVTTAAGKLRPQGDYLGSAQYRGEMARVCLRRALEGCMEQIG